MILSELYPFLEAIQAISGATGSKVPTESVFTLWSELPTETTQDRTQTKDTHPVPGWRLKFLIPPGIELGP